MSFNNSNEEGHYDNTRVVGKGTDGAMQMTFCAILGVAMIVIGVLFGVFMNTRTSYGFVYGIPIVIAGIVIPLLLLLSVARTNVEKPRD